MINPSMDETPTLARLVRAADAAVRSAGLDAVSIEAVASSAGVSRATAFRQLGNREDMIIAVGVLRAAEYARGCIHVISGHSSVFDQLEAAFQYLVRELPSDPVMNALIAAQTAADIGDETHDLVVATFGGVVERGRAEGLVRSDVSEGRIMTWFVEQLYLAMQNPDRDTEAVRDRVRLLLIPALAPPRAIAPDLTPSRERIETLSTALEAANAALRALRDSVA